MDAAAGLQGIRFLSRLTPLLERLHDEACARDRAGNRRLFMDQACALILLTFFNPTIRTLRDLERASRLRSVRKRLGCDAASIGSLSESLRLFDAERLTPILAELLGRIPAAPHADPRLKQLAQIPTAVDGTFLRRLPQLAEAACGSRDRGFKLHAHFEVLRGVPTAARITAASGRGPAGEKEVLRTALEPGRCYVVDRGYEEFALFNAIVAVGSSYVCRVRNDHGFTRRASRALPAEAVAGGVLTDEVGRFGSEKSRRIEHPDHEQRRIEVRLVEPPKRGGRRRSPATQNIVLATNLSDVPADVVVALYRYRWLIELFFRWLKCVLGCRHLVSQSRNGVAIQAYCALIAYLLVQLAAGGDVRPTSWTYKLLCLYAQGWADADEVLAHFDEPRRQQAAAATP